MTCDLLLMSKNMQERYSINFGYIMELNFTTWSEGEMHKGPCYEMLFGDVNIANIRFVLATSIYILVVHFFSNESLSLHHCHKMT
jgi:hypothetical protein